MMEKRWLEAQAHEKGFWEKTWNEKVNANNYLKAHLEIFEKFARIEKKDRVLEIGGGPMPLLKLVRAERYSLDPLMNFFRKNFELPKGIKHIDGKAENLPFKDNFFDKIICINVLDHVHEPVKIIEEMNRVLKKGDRVYIAINCHLSPFKIYKDIKERLGVGEKHHPYSFSINEIKKMLNQANFKIELIYRGDIPPLYPKAQASVKRTLANAMRLLKEKGLFRFIDGFIMKSYFILGERNYSFIAIKK